VSTPGVDHEPTRKHHVEGQDEPTQGQFGGPVGSADPLWAHLDLCFCVVVVLRILRSVPGIHLCNHLGPFAPLVRGCFSDK
jgi:hypothetical protein